MRFRPFLLLAVVVALCAAGHAAIGQTRFSPGVVTKAALTQADLDEIHTYVTERLNVFRNAKAGDEEQLAKTRQELIDPLRMGGPVFNAAYSVEIVAQVAPLLGATGQPLPTVRLDAMIITSFLADPGAADLAAAGLGDANQGVRYWAAAAIGELARRDVLKDRPAVQTKLLAQLTAIASAEKDPYVLRRCLVAINGLNAADASAQLLTILNHRIAAHAENPSVSLTPEIEALRAMFSKLALARATDANSVPPALLMQVGLVTYRYAALTHALMAAERANPGEPEAMFDLADKALDYVRRQIIPDTKGSDAMLPSVLAKPQRVKALEFSLAQWKALLGASPFNFSAADLDLPPIKASAAPTSAPKAAATPAPAEAAAPPTAPAATPPTPAGPARPFGARPTGPRPAPPAPAPAAP